MATQGCEGFDFYASAAALLEGAWSRVDGAWSISTANPGTGAKALRCAAAGSSSPVARRALSSAQSTAGLGYRLFLPNLPSVGASGLGLEAIKLGWFLDAGGVCSIGFVLETDGSISAYDGIYFLDDYAGGLGALVARSAPCVVVDYYQHLEMMVRPSAVGGAFEARVNGVTVLNFAGATLGASSGGVASVAIGGPATGAGVATMDVDDFHVWDGAGGGGPVDFVGPACVETRLLRAPVSLGVWAVVGVDGAPAALSDNSDATGIASPGVAHDVTLAIAALAADVRGIVYQQVSARVGSTTATSAVVTAELAVGNQALSSPDLVAGASLAWLSWASVYDPAEPDSPWSIDDANGATLTFIEDI